MAITNLKNIFASVFRQNLFANYVGVIVAILGPIISLPFYLKFLGPDQFGLLCFVILLQSTLSLLDAGMAQMLAKEIASRSNDHRGMIYSFIINVERIYWFSAFIVAFSVLLASNFISLHWLNVGKLQSSLTSITLCGSAIIFFFQFPGAFYRSFLIASQYQVQFNKILTLFSLFRHVGGLIMVCIYPSILIYILWNIFAAILEVTCRRLAVYRYFDRQLKKNWWNTTEILSFLNRSKGISFAVWLGAIATQADKIILSKMINLEQFGYYSLASSIALGSLHLGYPLLQAIQPKIISLKNNQNYNRVIYIKLFLIILLIFTVAFLTFVFFGGSLLDLWLNNHQAAVYVHQYASILLFGALLNSLYNVGYMDWILRGCNKKIFKINLASLVFLIFSLPILVHFYGVRGASFGWVLVNAFCFLLSLEWLKRGHIFGKN